MKNTESRVRRRGETGVCKENTGIRQSVEVYGKCATTGSSIRCDAGGL